MNVFTLIIILLVVIAGLSCIATVIYMAVYKLLINRRLHAMGEDGKPGRSLMEPLKFFLITALVFCVLGFLFLSFVSVGG